jgi:glycogen synthase
LRILIFSGTFFPRINGEVTLTHLLATQFARAGHSVRVVTLEKEPIIAGLCYPVTTVEKWNAIGHIRASDVVLVQSFPRSFLACVLVCRRPAACIYNVSAPGLSLPRWGSLLQRIRQLGTYSLPQHLLLRGIHGVGVSEFIRLSNPAVKTVIHNPYDNHVFCRLKDPHFRRDIIHTGRLGWGKGTWHFLRALGLLRQNGIVLDATLVGPFEMEQTKLDQWIQENQVAGQVKYLGSKKSGELASLMQQHRVAVIPSLGEPFGIAAIEALACGCRVAASNIGGLPEALGRHALFHNPDDVETLASNIATLVSKGPYTQAENEEIDDHLAQFHPRVIANHYLDLLKCLAEVP